MTERVLAVSAESGGKPQSGELLKLALEFGPLAVFFLANALTDIFRATALFMVATVLSLITSRVLLKRIPIMPLVSGVLVLVFGALTIYLHNDLFIKIKPTIVNLLFATILLVGLWANRLFIKMLLGEALQLTDTGWRKLQSRQGVFFIFLAGLNELVWRTSSDAFWAGFKIFGVMPLVMAFMVLQLWLVRHEMLLPKPAEAEIAE
jgi:intracellular septation protein